MAGSGNISEEYLLRLASYKSGMSPFLTICIFVQQWIYFDVIVAIFPRFAVSLSVQSCIFDRVFMSACFVSLKKGQQEPDFSLRVDKNSNFPFKQHFLRAAPCSALAPYLLHGDNTQISMGAGKQHSFDSFTVILENRNG
ncbi:hypothetical protein NE619_09635 [Anaerovorax odorimutans]|uniref:Uncharacterized protein n=1 Tax=Anaerovorax odorimutans TaxID=109327 RepID=A0ABT1RP83_9FIRM|nr:hypothetical protein [Anaerovorax odorimutans]